MKLKVKTERVIEVSDWDDFVSEVYGRPYCLQQQDGCYDRGNVYITVPEKHVEDYEATSIPRVVNHKEKGISFEAWLKEDPKAPMADGRTDYSIGLWWDRNCYPALGMIVNDLHAKGLLEEGDYTINIDW